MKIDLPILDFVGVENAKKLRDGITDMILEQIRKDIQNGRDYIDGDDIFALVQECVEELKPSVQKRLKKILSEGTEK